MSTDSIMAEVEKQEITTKVKTIVKPLGNKKVVKQRDTFIDFVKVNAKKNFCIINHDSPDCDSIAAAYGMAVIVEFLGAAGVTIVYDKDISHPQNRALMNVLSVPLKKWTNAMDKEFTDDNTVFIYVDCLPNGTNVSIKKRASIVVDHHGKAVQDDDIIFIHDEVGACATLVTDLMLQMPPQGKEPNMLNCFASDQEEIQSLCTALAIGIKVDTNDFSDSSEMTSDIDFKAYKILTANMLKDKFIRINKFELPKYLMEYERASWENRNEHQEIFIAGLGKIPIQHSDCLGYLSDKYLRLPGVETVLTYALVDNKVKASIRSVSASVSVSTLCEEIFGKGNGGAKPSQGVGGAVIELPVALFGGKDATDEETEDLCKYLKKRIERRFLEISSK